MEYVIKKNSIQKFLCAFMLLCIMLFAVNFNWGRVQHSVTSKGPSFLSHVLDIVFPKMDVQAGEIKNGYTVATDLSGTAYSVFSEANSTLYITRSDNTSLQIGDKFPEFTDDQGNKITDGVVAQRDIENNGTQYSGDGVY